MPAANTFQITELLSMTRCLHFGLILDLLVLGAFSENTVYNRKEEMMHLLLQMDVVLTSSMF